MLTQYSLSKGFHRLHVGWFFNQFARGLGDLDVQPNVRAMNVRSAWHGVKGLGTGFLIHLDLREAS